MRRYLVFLLAVAACNPSLPTVDAGSDMSLPDIASRPDLWMCSDLGQPCGLDAYQCCAAARFPLTCIAGACTICADKPGQDCTTMPCCGKLLCEAGACKGI